PRCPVRDRVIITATSAPPGIPGAVRLAGWIGASARRWGRASGRRAEPSRRWSPTPARWLDADARYPGRPRWARPFITLHSEAELGGARRPAHAGPEPGAPLSPGVPLGFRLPSCRGPAPRLRRTSTQDDAPPPRLADARLGNERGKLSASPAAAETSAPIAAATSAPSRP